MRTARITDQISSIGRAYLRLAKSVGYTSAGILTIVLISAGIVTPLWFLATRYTGLYTAAIVGGSAIALVITLVVRLRKDRSRRRSYLIKTLRLLGTIAAAAVFYLVLLLYSHGIYGLAVSLTLLGVIGGGLLLHAKQKNRS